MYVTFTFPLAYIGNADIGVRAQYFVMKFILNVS